jgi:hypothetical protein
MRRLWSKLTDIPIDTRKYQSKLYPKSLLGTVYHHSPSTVTSYVTAHLRQSPKSFAMPVFRVEKRGGDNCWDPLQLEEYFKEVWAAIATKPLTTMNSQWSWFWRVLLLFGLTARGIVEKGKLQDSQSGMFIISGNLTGLSRSAKKTPRPWLPTSFFLVLYRPYRWKPYHPWLNPSC